MSKFWQKFDSGVVRFVDSLSAISLIILTIVIMILVLCRYAFKVSVSGLSELPTYLLYFNVWIAAAMNAHDKNGHIALDFIGVFVKNQRFRDIVNIFLYIIAVVAMCLFTYCSYLEVVSTYARNTITPSMKLPLWIVYSFICLSAFLMSIYNLRRFCLAIKEVVKS